MHKKETSHYDLMLVFLLYTVLQFCFYDSTTTCIESIENEYHKKSFKGKVFR